MFLIKRPAPFAAVTTATVAELLTVVTILVKYISCCPCFCFVFTDVASVGDDDPGYDTGPVTTAAAVLLLNYFLFT